MEMNLQFFGGRGGSGLRNSSTISESSNVVSYDIEDEADRKGYASAEIMVQENLTEGNSFWTRDSEMIDDVEDLGYMVVSRPNGESFTVIDENDNTDSEFIVYYERAGSSRYITKVKKA